mmetsp:Transcript_3432/g.12461  ORF Transcript_3432/g.12461 Transcript_3432/m.12461 type:complete len:112 (+) Transcript_3432:864-1199(+)
MGMPMTQVGLKFTAETGLAEGWLHDPDQAPPAAKVTKKAAPAGAGIEGFNRKKLAKATTVVKDGSAAGGAGGGGGAPSGTRPGGRPGRGGGGGGMSLQEQIAAAARKRNGN